MPENLVDIPAEGEKMRNVVRVSLLAAVLLLFVAPAAHAWCYEVGLGTVCQGDFQSASSVSIVVNEYGTFGYDFTPEHDGGVHWNNTLTPRAPDCCWNGVNRMYAKRGVGDFKEHVYAEAESGQPYAVVDALAYLNVFSVQAGDLLLAQALQKSAERQLWLAAHTSNTGLVQLYIKEAEKDFQLAEKLRSQYYGMPGGL